jgi:hypothetical protein
MKKSNALFIAGAFMMAFPDAIRPSKPCQNNTTRQSCSGNGKRRTPATATASAGNLGERWLKLILSTIRRSFRRLPALK